MAVRPIGRRDRVLRAGRAPAGLRVAAMVTLILGISQCVPSPIYHSDGGASPRRPSGSTGAAAPVSGPAAGGPQAAHPVDLAQVDKGNAYQIGVASYYGKKFHLRPTASGETFNMYKLTAAHRVLPLGTMARVTNLANGRWVDVKVNDRGPFIEGRILDLSFAAALELEMVEAGTSEVMIEILETPE